MAIISICDTPYLGRVKIWWGGGAQNTNYKQSKSSGTYKFPMYHMALGFPKKTLCPEQK